LLERKMKDGYEKDGFVVDDIDEEGEEEQIDSDKRQKKKRKKKRASEKNYELDEDDYELLQESNISVQRRKPEIKNFKRLKRARGNVGEGISQFSAEEKLKRSLFGDDDGKSLGEKKVALQWNFYGYLFEDIAKEEEPLEMEHEGIDEEDEMADFIVDGEEYDEHGAPVRRRKPKITRQCPGISSSSLQAAHEIFGDAEDLLRMRKLDVRDMYDETGGVTLEDQFDPSLRSEKYMTKKDAQIRKIDIPERVQISEASTGVPSKDEKSIQMETEWIFSQLVRGTGYLFSQGNSTIQELNEEFKHHIARLLELMHAEKLDVPFISMYRKEQISTLLRVANEPEADTDDDPNSPTVKLHKLLWTIHDLDQKWLLLEKRKSALLMYFRKRFEDESQSISSDTRQNLNQQIYDSVMISLAAANSETEVDDLDLKFNLYFPPSEVVPYEGQYKRPKRKSRYSMCYSSGLWEVARKFCYSAEQFGLLLSLEEVRTDELEDPKETPEEMAWNFTCAMFQNSEVVLNGTRHMAAVEISCEPRVRKHVRSIFMDGAVVTTIPTASGSKTIDSFHQFAGVKWLKNKPLNEFQDAQWLIIQKAEEEKLLEVTIKLPEEKLVEKLIADAGEYYLSDGVSKSAKLWNEQRKLILIEAFHTFLFPSMEKEARLLLSSRAKTWLLWDYGMQLWNKVSVAPFQAKHNVADSNEKTTPRVMACCWGPGKPPTTFVMLDSFGEVIDILHASSLNLRGQSVYEQQSKKNDQQRVHKFIMDHQPHVVVLGAANLSCTRLKEDIYE
ncbi:hypothetical protein M569_11596, partial [Genlisea aurea]